MMAHITKLQWSNLFKFQDERFNSIKVDYSIKSSKLFNGRVLVVLSA